MKRLLPLALCLFTLPAMAHPDHGGASLMAGLAHPFTGLDHLLAMLGIGIWSRQQQRGGMLIPAFLLMMALGAVLPLAVPLLETGLALSVLLTGALLLAAARLPALAAVTVVGLFALLHGQAHGQELPGAASGLGFVLASAALLCGGRLLGGARIERAAGALLGAAGLCLLAGVA